MRSICWVSPRRNGCNQGMRMAFRKTSNQASHGLIVILSPSALRGPQGQALRMGRISFPFAQWLASLKTIYHPDPIDLDKSILTRSPWSHWPWLASAAPPYRGACLSGDGPELASFASGATPMPPGSPRPGPVRPILRASISTRTRSYQQKIVRGSSSSAATYLRPTVAQDRLRFTGDGASCWSSRAPGTMARATSSSSPWNSSKSSPP